MSRLIDADALKDELELADFETDSRMFGGQTVLFEDSVFKIVDSAPAISPDEVRGVGEWIEDRMDYRCSACGETVKDEIFYMFYPYRLPKFCPNCGAKMEVSEDA